jgi:Zn-finger nucleic acid-binding protein
MKLKRREYKIGSGINVDQCYGCNGIWLDAGELAAIRENFDEIQAQSKNIVNSQMNSAGIAPVDNYKPRDIRELSIFSRFLKGIF